MATEQCGRALVVPAFEINADTPDAPTDLSRLRALWDQHEAEGFHVSAFPRGCRAPLSRGVGGGCPGLTPDVSLCLWCYVCVCVRVLCRPQAYIDGLCKVVDGVRAVRGECRAWLLSACAASSLAADSHKPVGAPPDRVFDALRAVRHHGQAASAWYELLDLFHLFRLRSCWF
eukprot:2565971-Rhodomonas_salina.3